MKRPVRLSPSRPPEKARTGRSLMKNTFASSRTGLLALLVSGAILAGCSKSEQPQGSADPGASPDKAAAKRSATEETGAHEANEKHGGAEPLKLSAEEIQAAGIKIEDLDRKSVV